MANFDNGWLYEAGIGENRALLVENGQLVRARIERHGGGAKTGAIVDAKFKDQWVAGTSGIIVLDSGEECLLQPLPKGLTEGASVRVEIVRAALNERGGQSKRPKAKAAKAVAALRAGPNLLEQMEASGTAS